MRGHACPLPTELSVGSAVVGWHSARNLFGCRWYLSLLAARDARGAIAWLLPLLLACLAPTALPAGGGVVAGDALTTTVLQRPCPVTLLLTGTLEADERADVASNVNGIARDVLVDRGSVVQKGDLLVQVDPTDARNQLAEGLALAEELRVRLGLPEQAGESKPFRPEDLPEVTEAVSAEELATANLQRVKQLMGASAVSQELLDQRQMEFDSARDRRLQALQRARQLYQGYLTVMARVTTLRKALDDTSIRAPFSGIVAEKYVNTGERILANPMPGMGKIVSLVRIDPLRLLLTVPQQDVAAVHPGQRVTFTVDAHPGRTFEGRIRALTPAVSPETRSLVVEARVPNPGRELLPGMFVTARLEVGGVADGLFVPAGALRRRGDASSVFVVSGGIQHEALVVPGDRIGDLVRIISGLAPGDRVLRDASRGTDGGKTP